MISIGGICFWEVVIVLFVVAAFVTPVVIYFVLRNREQRRKDAEPEFDLDDES